jgi:hypothetical protein
MAVNALSSYMQHLMLGVPHSPAQPLAASLHCRMPILKKAAETYLKSLLVGQCMPCSAVRPLRDRPKQVSIRT